MPSGLAAMVRVRRWWPVGWRLRVRKTSTGWQLVPERLSPGRWPTGWVSRRGSQLRAPRRRRDAEPWPATMTVASSSRLRRRLADTPLKSMRVPPRGSELPARPPAQQGNRANSLVAGMVWPSFVCAHELSATRITRPIATQTASVAAARSPIPRWAAEAAGRPSPSPACRACVCNATASASGSDNASASSRARAALRGIAPLGRRRLGVDDRQCL